MGAAAAPDGEDIAELTKVRSIGGASLADLRMSPPHSWSGALTPPRPSCIAIESLMRGRVKYAHFLRSADNRFVPGLSTNPAEEITLGGLIRPHIAVPRPVPSNHH